MRRDKLSRNWDELCDPGDTAERMVADGRPLEAIVYLLQQGFPNVAKVTCAELGDGLTKREKIRVVEAFLDAGELDHARRLRYFYRLGWLLRKDPNHHVLSATWQRLRRDR